MQEKNCRKLLQPTSRRFGRCRLSVETQNSYRRFPASARAAWAQTEPVVREPVRCANCGSVMRIVAVVNVNCRVLIEHSVDYLDSG
jgi:hypothetical protein